MAILNEGKLLESDFIDRFLGFVEAYEEVRGINLIDTVEEWLSYNKKEYDNIKYFLQTSSTEYNLPFTIQDFISMSSNELIAYQEKCTKISALLDEKRALYQEFILFYE